MSSKDVAEKSPSSPQLGQRSALHVPSIGLASCVRAFYWHDLPQDGTLSPELRLSWIPPNPYVSLVWLVSGDAMLVESHGQRCKFTLPPVFVAGPTRHGWRSIALSTYQSFGVVFQPAAFALLTGLHFSAIEEPRHDAHALLDSSWNQLVDAVATATDHQARMVLCDSFLSARWAAVRPAPSVWERLTERAWCQPARTAAIGALNWTARHFQRRTRALTGLSPSEVARMIRLEQALLDLRDARGTRAEVAASHGYADQPHFTREVRRTYGRSPGELLNDVSDVNKHADWLLRL